jgi:MFS family permease
MTTSTLDVPYENRKLFVISVIALVAAGMSFSLRGRIGADLETIFLKPIDALTSAKMLGRVLGIPFLGFAFTIAIGSPLLDFLGMGRLLALASICFLGGTAIVIGTDAISHQGFSPYTILQAGMLLTGIGWGLVETVINPLAAALYPSDKTHKLNVLHAWWPGGIIIGAVMAEFIGNFDITWQQKFALGMIPAVIFGVMLIGTKFPPTERVAHGVGAGEMFREVFRPGFLLWFLCMFLTAASELAPGTWVDNALTRTVGMQGIWLLVYISGLMFVMRHFAGPLAHKFSPVGLLWVSCLLASLGLFALSYANSPATGLLSATLWGIGVCYMWPTMLASASERYPRGGALLMGLMGTAGTLSIAWVLPKMGDIFDHYKIKAAGGEEAFNALAPDSPEMNAALTVASEMSFRYVAILPAILLVVFGLIWLRDRARGGFRPVDINE